MKRKIATILAVTITMLSIFGCNNSSSTTTANPTPSATESETVAEDKTEEPEATPSINITSLTAEEIVKQFSDAGFPIEKVIVYTEENDVNELLGRPNQYTSKVNFADSRAEQTDIEIDPVGGSVEVFNNATDAQSRKEYIESVTSTMPTMIQYMYIYENVLLRIDKALTPTQAAEYESAFKSLCEGSSIEYSSDTNNGTQNNDPSYEISYQSILFNTDDYGSIWSQAFAEVTNTGNSDLYLERGSYELIATDGTVIHSSNGSFVPYPQIIAPGETGYYYEAVPMDTGTPTEGISIVPHLNAATSSLQNIRLEVTDTAIYDKQDYGSIDLHGKVKNTSDATQELLTVAAILFDHEEKPIGQLYTMLSSPLQPGEEIGFELEPFGLPDDLSSADIGSYKVFAFPEQYQF